MTMRKSLRQFVPTVIILVLVWIQVFQGRRGPPAIPESPVVAATMSDPISPSPPEVAQVPEVAEVFGTACLYFSSYDDDCVYALDDQGHMKCFVSGLSGPGGMTFDSHGNLYVANYLADTVTQIAPAGDKSVYASDFDHPSGVIFDKSGNLYVANSVGNTITLVSPDGNRSTFATGLSRPTQMIFDSQGNMYVANGDSGIIYRIPRAGGEKILVATLSEGLCGLAINGEGDLFAGVGTWSFNDGVMYKITPAGKVSTFVKLTFAPFQMHMDAAGALYVGVNRAPRGDTAIYKVLPDGSVKELVHQVLAASDTIPVEK
jgi:DNA-binding beta-propeller fold protein YncE